MNPILTLDHQLFTLIYQQLPRTPALEVIALTLSGAGMYGLIWFLVGMYMVVREEKRSHWFFLPLILAVVAGLVAAEFILKPLFARHRPTDVLGMATILGVGDMYSFPSGHTTVAFACATVLSYFERKSAKWFYLLAAGIGLSRIYLGKHYPIDVFAGAVLGTIIGYVALKVSRIVAPRSVAGIYQRPQKIRRRKASR